MPRPDMRSRATDSRKKLISTGRCKHPRMKVSVPVPFLLGENGLGRELQSPSRTAALGPGGKRSYHAGSKEPIGIAPVELVL